MRTVPAVLLILAFSLIIMPVSVDDTDAAATHRGGYGHGEGIDVEYTEDNGYNILITLKDMPSGPVSVMVLSSTVTLVVDPIEASRVFAIEAKNKEISGLEKGEYTVYVNLHSDNREIASCKLTVTDVCYAQYRSNGGSGLMLSGVSENGKITLRQNTFDPPSGHSFKAWNVSGREYAPGSSVAVDDDITVTAVWQEGTPSSGDGGNMPLIIGGIAAVIVVLAILAFVLIRRRSD